MLPECYCAVLCNLLFIPNFMVYRGETLMHCCLVYFLLVNIGEVINVVHASAYNFSFSKYYTYLTCPNLLKVLNFKAKTFTV